MSKRLSSIIVDDDPVARKFLERLCGKIEALAPPHLCENAKEARKILEEEDIDIIFLDVEMPEVSGLELMDSLPYLPNVIMTTANKEYAYQAFEYEVVDFLKKPITFPRFKKAIDKVLEEEESEVSSEEFTTREIFIKDNKKLVKIAYEDILFIENVGDYAKIVTKDKNYVTYGTIKSIAKKLPENHFVKVHRGYIINFHEIKDIEGGSVVIDDHVIPVSRSHKSDLMDRLNLL